MNLQTLGAVLVPLGFLLSLTPWINSAGALALGIMTSLIVGNPYSARTAKLTRPMLSLAIIALGAGMNLIVVGHAGLNGLVVTLVGLSLTMALGFLIGRAFKVGREISILVSVGTAICGGSAIAAVSSAIGAKENETSVALAVVFVLNAVALLIFPLIGHAVGLEQHQFGLWSAMAIHDTSSVVGASIQYGPKALEIGTTVKLARALWIVPVTLVIAHFYKKNLSSEAKVKAQYPWFILGFIAASAAATFIPALHDVGQTIEMAGRHLFVATLYLIGLGLTLKKLREVGARPLLQGVTLWVLVASANLLLVYFVPGII